MRRVIEPELLDQLAAGDPRAIGSRGDLRRLNFIMGHAGVFARALRGPLNAACFRSRPVQLVELGAGDGRLLLGLARQWSRLGLTGRVTLLDRQELVCAATRHAFATLNWPVECVTTDVFAWLRKSPAGVDVMLANLFLHHFPPAQLGVLLHLCAAWTDLFLTCEPRRAPLALAASRMLWGLGCNRVTRQDAVTSVRAGFRWREISALWPTDKNNSWTAVEQSAGLFSHCFMAQRHG